MKLCEIIHNIKGRTSANDVFINPLPLAKFHIDMIDVYDDEIWYDPFKNNGSYYNQFPTKCKKVWSEILDGKDFFKFNDRVDVICSNPPFSICDEVFKKSVELNPRVISYLIGHQNLTPRRLEFMNNNDYGLTNIHFTKVRNWFGFTTILVFEKGKSNMEGFSYDRRRFPERGGKLQPL